MVAHAYIQTLKRPDAALIYVKSCQNNDDVVMLDYSTGLNAAMDNGLAVYVEYHFDN